MTGLVRKLAAEEARVLSDSDRVSATWLRLKKHYEQRLDMLRKSNDAMLDESKTAELRGQIREIKRLLSLDADPPDFEVTAPVR